MNQHHNYGISGQEAYDNFLCFGGKKCKEKKKERQDARSERRKIRTERKRARTEQRQLDNEGKRIENEAMKRQVRQEQKDARMSAKLTQQLLEQQATATSEAPQAEGPMQASMKLGGAEKYLLPVVAVVLVGGFLFSKFGTRGPAPAVAT